MKIICIEKFSCCDRSGWTFNAFLLFFFSFLFFLIYSEGVTTLLFSRSYFSIGKWDGPCSFVYKWRPSGDAKGFPRRLSLNIGDITPPMVLQSGLLVVWRLSSSSSSNWLIFIYWHWWMRSSTITTNCHNETTLIVQSVDFRCPLLPFSFFFPPQVISWTVINSPAIYPPYSPSLGSDLETGKKEIIDRKQQGEKKSNTNH